MLVHHSLADAHRELKRGLRRLLWHLGTPPSAYHEAPTRTWLMAVARFMHRAGRQESSEAFLRACKRLLDKEIMSTHYRRETMDSDLARRRFVEPDLRPIPCYDTFSPDDR